MINACVRQSMRTVGVRLSTPGMKGLTLRFGHFDVNKCLKYKKAK